MVLRNSDHPFLKQTGPVRREGQESGYGYLLHSQFSIVGQDLIIVLSGDFIEEYKGGKEVESARKFIKNAYNERNHSSKNERDLYVHCTTGALRDCVLAQNGHLLPLTLSFPYFAPAATDTKNILTVFDAVQDIFLSAALDEFNL